eukprot:6197819-Pleurochrysis_carterae.AAC.1
MRYLSRGERSTPSAAVQITGTLLGFDRRSSAAAMPTRAVLLATCAANVGGDGGDGAGIVREGYRDVHAASDVACVAEQSRSRA